MYPSHAIKQNVFFFFLIKLSQIMIICFKQKLLPVCVFILLINKVFVTWSVCTSFGLLHWGEVGAHLNKIPPPHSCTSASYLWVLCTFLPCCRYSFLKLDKASNQCWVWEQRGAAWRCCSHGNFPGGGGKGGIEGHWAGVNPHSPPSFTQPAGGQRAPLTSLCVATPTSDPHV